MNTAKISQRSEKEYMYYFLLLLVGAVLAYTLISMIKNYQGIYLLVFGLFYLIIPGWGLGILLDGELFEKRSMAFLLSVFIGFFLLVVQYYLFLFLGKMEYIKLVPVALGAILLFFVWKKGKHRVVKKYLAFQVEGILPILVFIAALTIYIYVVLVKTVPNKECTVFVDYAYHMGNVATLTRGQDLTDIRICGMTFKYHYFMDLFYGILRNVFPASIFNCIFRYPILIVPPVACLSFYKMIGMIVKHSGFTVLLSGISMGFACLRPHYTHLLSHIGTNINSVGIALPCVITLLLALVYLLKNKRIEWGRYAILFFLSICLTGLKGPFSMVVVGSSVLLLLYLIVKEKKMPTFWLMAVLVMMIAFGIIWYFLLRGAVNGDNLEDNPSGIQTLIKLGGIITPDGIGDIQGKQGIYILYTIICAFGLFSVPFVLSSVSAVIAIVKGYRIETRWVFLEFFAWLAITCNFILSVAHNRIYFLMLAVPVVSALGVYWEKEYIKKGKYAVFGVITSVISICLLAIAIIHGIKQPMIYIGSGTLSQNEIEAVGWIRQNVENDAILAINDHQENGKFFYFSAYTERQFFIETSEYAMNSGKTESDLVEQIENNDSLFAENNPHRNDEAYALGIDYLIQIDYSGEFQTDLSSECELCFSNDTIKIFRIISSES